MNKIIVTLIIFMIAASVCAPAYAKDQGVNSLNITLEDLAKMPTGDREQVLQAYNTLKESQAATDSLSTTAKDAVEDGLKMVDGINLNDLTEKAEKIADAVIAFCTKLGIGVEKLLTSKVGMIILIITAFKIGMFGTVLAFFNTIVGITACCVGGMLFTYILFGLNTNKKVVLNKTVKNDEGKIISTTTEEEFVPRFNALFNKFTGTESSKDIKAYYNEVSSYRVWASLFSVAVIIICIISL